MPGNLAVKGKNFSLSFCSKSSSLSKDGGGGGGGQLSKDPDPPGLKGGGGGRGGGEGGGVPGGSDGGDGPKNLSTKLGRNLGFLLSSSRHRPCQIFSYNAPQVLDISDSVPHQVQILFPHSSLWIYLSA